MQLNAVLRWHNIIVWRKRVRSTDSAETRKPWYTSSSWSSIVYCISIQYLESTKEDLNSTQPCIISTINQQGRHKLAHEKASRSHGNVFSVLRIQPFYFVIVLHARSWPKSVWKQCNICQINYRKYNQRTYFNSESQEPCTRTVKLFQAARCPFVVEGNESISKAEQDETTLKSEISRNEMGKRQLSRDSRPFFSTNFIETKPKKFSVSTFLILIDFRQTHK